MTGLGKAGSYVLVHLDRSPGEAGAPQADGVEAAVSTVRLLLKTALVSGISFTGPFLSSF